MKQISDDKPLPPLTTLSQWFGDKEVHLGGLLPDDAPRGAFMTPEGIVLMPKEKE